MEYMELDQLRRNIASCERCNKNTAVHDSGSIVQSVWYVECECGYRGPEGLERDAIEGWNEMER